MAVFGISSQTLADGELEVEIFEAPDYVKTFYKKLVNDNNIDTSFKFKQSALNGVLLGLYAVVWKTYYIATFW